MGKYKIVVSILLAVFIISLLLPSNIEAQYRRQNSGEKGEFVIFAEGGYKYFMGAEDTFNALYESSGGLLLGGGIKYTLPSGLYFAGELQFSSFSGEKVWVSSTGTVIKTGTSEDMTLMPLLVSIGYYFTLEGSVRPYAGLGGGFYILSTTTEGADESNDENGFGFFALFGIDFPLSDTFKIGIEGRYEMVPDIIGAAGVPAVFEENDLGGISGLVKIQFIL